MCLKKHCQGQAGKTNGLGKRAERLGIHRRVKQKKKKKYWSKNGLSEEVRTGNEGKKKSCALTSDTCSQLIIRRSQGANFARKKKTVGWRGGRREKTASRVTGN